MEISYFTHVATLAGLAVLVVHQLLKLKFIPAKFANDHPVPANIILSVIAAAIVTFKTELHPHAWTDWIILVATISIVAAVTYNMLFKNWTELRDMEGPDA